MKSLIERKIDKIIEILYMLHGAFCADCSGDFDPYIMRCCECKYFKVCRWDNIISNKVKELKEIKPEVTYKEKKDE